MTRPRQVSPGDVVFCTRRCTRRQFLLRPDPDTCQILEYCLAYCAAKYGIELHEFVVMSNHYHLVVSDPLGNRPDFFRDLNKLVSSAINCRFGQFENLFEPGSYNAVRLLETSDLEDKCVYTLANPTEAGLVSSPRYWEGVISWNMAYGEVKQVERPSVYFRDCMPATAALVLTRPPGFDPRLTDHEVRERIRQRARAKAADIATRIRDAGGGFMGMKRVLKQQRTSSPATRAPRFGIRPNVAGRSKWARIEALQALKTFLTRYAQARLAWLAGDRDTEFPPGTYLMAHRFGVRVAPAFN